VHRRNPTRSAATAVLALTALPSAARPPRLHGRSGGGLL